MSFLVLDALEKTYPDGTKAVKDVSLEIEEGEFIVLLGPSGCGKTTTLRMLAGLEMPTGGTILLGNQDQTRLTPSERDVGFVFQFYALYPHMSVSKNIAFPLENMGLVSQEVDRLVSEVSRHVGITEHLHHHPGQLSGGDQQRVALARAMVRRPKMFLMDEPLGTLDADRRLAMREFIREQQIESGITTVYVTHDQEEAMALADRIVVMRGGRIDQFDTPTKVYEHPADPLTAQFVGSPGMNLFTGELVVDGTDRYLRSGDITIDADTKALSDIADGPVTFGLRSEYLIPDDAGILQAETVLVERLGSHCNVYFDSPVGRLVMRTESDISHMPGDTLKLGYDTQHLRIWAGDYARPPLEVSET